MESEAKQAELRLEQGCTIKASKHPRRKQILIGVWPHMSTDDADMDVVEHFLAQRYVIKDRNSFFFKFGRSTPDLWLNIGRLGK